MIRKSQISFPERMVHMSLPVSTLLDDVEETLGVEFDKEDKDNFDTLNGFMVSRLGHIPKAGRRGVSGSGTIC